jgi:hypothetical protein
MRFKLRGRWYQLRRQPAKTIGDIFVCNSIDVCDAGGDVVLKLVQWEDGGAWEAPDGTRDADPRALAMRCLR